MRGALKALVTVELQLPSGLLFSHCIVDGVEYKAHGLIGSGFVGDNAAVKEVADDAKVQDTLRCVNVGYFGYPLLIGQQGGEVTVQQIFIAVKLLSHNPVLLPAADFRQQDILPHDPQYGFRVTVNPLLFKS